MRLTTPLRSVSRRTAREPARRWPLLRLFNSTDSHLNWTRYRGQAIPAKEITLILSYRESEATLWASTTKWMRQSFSITPNADQLAPLASFGLFVVDGDLMSIRFPGEFQKSSQSLPIPGGTASLTVASSGADGLIFSVAYGFYDSEGVLDIPISDRIDGAVSGGLAAMGAELTKETSFMLEGVEAARVEARVPHPSGGEALYYRAIVAMKGPHLAMASVVVPFESRADPRIDTFLEGLQVAFE